MKLLTASTFGSAHGVLHSTAIGVALNVLLLVAVVFWLGLAHWVYRDARRRMDDPWLVGTATALGVVPPYLGPVIYLLFRPPETIDDIRAREVEVQALEQRLVRRDAHCPVCHAEVGASFLVCPVCTTQLRQPCEQCEAPLDRLWQMCPYCATPVVATSAQDLDAALTAELRTNGTRTPQRKRAAAPR